jgi:UDPglucose 6-dehydrogenase
VMFGKICQHFGGKEKLKGLEIAIWGLSFKAKTDDVRESPALTLISRLLECEAQVNISDPRAMANARQIFGNRIKYCQSNYDCLKGVSALAIATEWNEFRSPNYEKMKELMKNPVIFDGRNLLNAQHLKRLGFTYHGVGL